VLLLVDGAAAYYCAEDLSFSVFGWGDLGQVGGEDEEVGVLTYFQGAFFCFFELGVGGADGVAADAVFEGDFFLGLPATRGTAFWEFASHAGVEAAHGVDGLDGIVGAKSQMYATSLQGGPSVSSFDAVGTDALFGPAHVGRLVGRLHGGDDVEFCETREILGRDHLGVLDAVAAVARRIGLGDRFEDVEGDAVGAVADGVKG